MTHDLAFRISMFVGIPVALAIAYHEDKMHLLFHWPF